MAADARVQAARTLACVFRDNASLQSLIPRDLSKVADSERSLYRELCFGSLRYFHRLNSVLGQLLDKPMAGKDSDIQALLLIGLYQLEYTRVPDHAAISTCVDASRKLKKPWASKLINAVLRRFQRERESLLDALKNNPSAHYSHPKWIIKALDAAYPNDASDVLAQNNQQPPMTLRVNQNFGSRSDYLQRLEQASIPAQACDFASHALTLEKPCDVLALPGFAEGHASVQDEAAQLSASLLDLAPNQRVLDACCAPGGKTCHILESEAELEAVVAVDLEAKRLERVKENLERLQLTAELHAADVGNLDDWWNGQLFDRILLDAPCSATGVIRRHPDIKLLRKPADIDNLAKLQGELLTKLWATLKPGGRLVYATCSVMPKENSQVIEQFVANQSDCQHQPIDASWGLAQDYGRQLLPQEKGHDGFYYAVLIKQSA